MKRMLENLLNLKIEIDYTHKGIKFENRNIEAQYSSANEKILDRKRFIVFFAIFLVYMYLIFFVELTLLDEQYKFDTRFFLTIAFAFIDTLSNVYFFLLIKCYPKKSFVESIIILRIIGILFCFYFYSFEKIFQDQSYPMIFRKDCMIILAKNLVYFLVCPHSIQLMIFFSSMNFTYIMLIHLLRANCKLRINLVIDVGVEILCSVLVFFLKRKNEIIDRRLFAQDLLINNIYVYIEDILSSLNCMHFSVKNGKVIHLNKYLESFIKDRIKISTFDKRCESLSIINVVDKISILDVKYNNIETSSASVIQKQNNKNNKKILSNINNKIIANIKNDEDKFTLSEEIIYKQKDYFYSNIPNNTSENLDKQNLNDNEMLNSIYQAEEDVQKFLLEHMQKLMKSYLNKDLSNNIHSFNLEEKKVSNFKDFYDFINNKIKTIHIDGDSNKFNLDLNKKTEIGKEELFTVWKHEKNDSNFTYVGEFYILQGCEIKVQTSNCHNNKESQKFIPNKKYYDIYFRQLNRISEFLIYEKTLSKVTEIDSIENQLKQTIFTKIAHEFKNPLNSIISLVENIKYNFTQDHDYSRTNFETVNCNNVIQYSAVKSFKHDMNIINSLANYIMFLISDIISYSFTEDNTKIPEININKGYVSLEKILNFNFEILKALISCNEIKSKNIQPLIRIDNDIINCKIKTDEFRLNQILLNLISNSVKFTMNGIIQISAETKKLVFEEKEENCICIIIEDSGIGIKNESIHRIFSDSYHLESEAKKGFSNQGLVNCVNVAKNLKYKIHFTSIENQGTKFFIEIPITIQSPIFHSSKNALKSDNLSAMQATQLNKSQPIKNQAIRKNSEASNLYISNITDYLMNKNNNFIVNNKSFDVTINNRLKSMVNKCNSYQANLSNRELKVVKTNPKSSKSLTKSEISDRYLRNLKYQNPVSSECETVINSRIMQIDKKNLFDYIKGNKINYKNQRLKKNLLTDLNLGFKEPIYHKTYSFSSEISHPIRNENKHSHGNKNYNFIDVFQQTSDLALYQNSSNTKRNLINNIFKKNCKNNNLLDDVIKYKRNDNKLKFLLNNNDYIETKKKEINFSNPYNNSDSKSKSLRTSNSISKLNVSILNKHSNILNFDNYKNEKNHKEIEDLNKSDISSFVFNNKTISKISSIIANNNHYNNLNKNAISNSNNCIASNCKFRNNLLKKKNKIQRVIGFSLINQAKQPGKLLTIGQLMTFKELKESQIVENSINTDHHVNRNLNYIVIVDDNRYARNAIRKSCEKILVEKSLLPYFEFLEGNDGIDTLNFVINPQYSNYIKLIITDENMEFMHGSEAIKIIREFEGLNKIKKYKIFSATSYEDKLTEKHIMDAGADMLLNKPFTKEKLLSAIESYKIL